MKKIVNWGIIAPGGIAEKFATGINAAENSQLYGVCSRDLSKAEKFIDKFGGKKAYNNEIDIANDPNIDIIYVSNPHPFHKDSALTCLNAGKAVLCEKPMTVTAKDTQELIYAARANNVFLMEAMWTRFLPIMHKIRELIADGAIGEIRMVTANFGFKCDYDPESRLLNPDLAGGALLDVGIYPLAFCSMLLGKPTKIQSSAHLGKTNIDEQFMLQFDYEDGKIASAYGAVCTQLAQDAYIYGTKGSIKVHTPWWHATTISLFRVAEDSECTVENFGTEEIITLPYSSNGYNCEAEAVASLILNNQVESDIMPLDESLELAETMDTARAQWGLKYPFE